jgi:hypothetical protein
MNEIFAGVIKIGAAALYGFLVGGGDSESAIRSAIVEIMADFTGDLPRDIKQSIISRGTLAILAARTKPQIELEITAMFAEIQEWVKKNA